VQTIQGRQWQGGNLMDFTISGTGGFDFDKGQYHITYATIFDDGGTLVTNKYTLIGALNM
ncbi:MAG TPA: hypothetical protein VIN07_14515, partial [Flavipsychrobacter sp.]